MKIGDRFQLRDFFDALSVHYFNAWMGDYNPDEVGEYLQDFSVGQTGKYDVTMKRGSMWKPSRGEFLKWRYSKNSSQGNLSKGE